MNDIMWSCCVRDNSESPDGAAELFDALGFQLSTTTDKKENIVRHSLYFDTEDEAREAARMISAQLTEWREMEIFLEEPSVASIRKEDWAESWKKHFPLLKISPRLVVRPSWIPFSPAPDQVVVELDPGMSFGTGQHPTTGFCLKMIDRLAESGSKKSFLDAGCGSGILALAAQKLGYSPVAAFDNDPDAIKVALENFAKNAIPQDAIISAVAPLQAYTPPIERFDVVAANILSSVLLGCLPKLLSLVKPGGHLILAGILASEYAELRKAFLNAKCQELHSEQENEWQGGLFRVPDKN